MQRAYYYLMPLVQNRLKTLEIWEGNMSHITTVQSRIKFKDPAALITALKSLGQVISTPHAISVGLTAPQDGITSLSFLQQADSWEARADQWGNVLNYEKLVAKVGQKYIEALSMSYIQKNHLSTVSQTTDDAGNIRIKVRSY